jgi:hypothetical protein
MVADLLRLPFAIGHRMLAFLGSGLGMLANDQFMLIDPFSFGFGSRDVPVFRDGFAGNNNRSPSWRRSEVLRRFVAFGVLSVCRGLFGALKAISAPSATASTATASASPAAGPLNCGIGL